MDKDRASCAMTALAHLRFWDSLFPNDAVPFVAVARALEVSQGEADVASLAEFRVEMRARVDALTYVLDAYPCDHGLAFAARESIVCVLCALDATIDEAACREAGNRARSSAYAVGKPMGGG